MSETASTTAEAAPTNSDSPTRTPVTPSTSSTSMPSDARLVHCVFLDGTFFRVVSISEEGAVKAMRTSCPGGKSRYREQSMQLPTS